jgi:hypothetical protein
MKLGIRRGWLVILACYLQPLSMVLSYTTLTENWAGLYLIGALTLLHRGSINRASCVFSLILVTRHEAIVLAPIWWLAVLTQSDRRSGVVTAVAASLWAPVAHNLLFHWRFDEWPIAIFFQPHGSTAYQGSGFLAYVPHALYAMTPLLAALAVYGGCSWARRGKWVIPAMAGSFFAVQLFIKWLGLFASGGFGRFMVAVAPLIAVLAAAGFESVGASLSAPRGAGKTRLAVLHAGVATIGPLLVVAALIQWCWVVRPLGLKPPHLEAQRIAQWIRAHGIVERPLFMTHPWLAFELDLAENPRAHKGAALLASMPVGTVVIWDSIYSPSDFHGIGIEAFEGNPDQYEPIADFPGNESQSTFRAFQKTRETPLPPLPERSYPTDLASRRRPVLGIYYVRTK